ncbi:MAG: hypothetical protein DHS20C18_06780 [Saprospiraceae bacterium]|nr:MAG: hypothetical protein DHS20C18_06780 [Saprospiraceae bacterium]
MDDMGNMFEVAPFDSSDSIEVNPCAGAVITRRWTAVDGNGMMATVSQLITVLPDSQGPVMPAPSVRDTVSCELSSISGSPTNPLRYDAWVNGVKLFVSTMAVDSCNSVFDIDDDAPPNYENDCGTLTVTFTLTDACMNETQWQAFYTVIDTVAPILSGVPVDTLRLSCEDPIPAAATVTATDNCAGMVTTTFVENNQQDTSITCNRFEYFIFRTWSASDNCGNTTEFEQIIIINDDTAPTFSAPAAVMINCSDDPDDLNLTGMVSGLADNCTPLDSIKVQYSDVTMDSLCDYAYTITRTWEARDLCGNITVRQQSIMVVDNEAPTFSVPADITINCDQAAEIGVTGQPTNVADNCDPAPVVSSEDIVSDGSCPNEYTIARTWTVTDACGRDSSQVQMITVVDQSLPVFDTPPGNLILNCTEGLNIQEAFDNWVSNHAGALASDNCSFAEDLSWTIYNAGTTTAASLPAPACPAASDTVRQQMIDISVIDECGNMQTSTVMFAVIDHTPPVIRECPAGAVIPTDTLSCDATYTLVPPVIEDACAEGFSTEMLSGNATLSSQAAPGQEETTPVDPIEIDLTSALPLPINALGDGQLTVSLISVDAEASTEFFNIYGEDGTFLGITALTPAQCQNSDTLLTLTAAQINTWMADGTLTIRLEPNLPADPRFAINQICNPVGMVNLDLTFTVKTLGSIVYEYRVDDLPRVAVDPIAPTAVSLSQGNHIIKYYATDCAGNIDSCAYSVTVEDREPPVILCPSDVTVSLAEDSCTVTVDLPLPSGATDNCAVYDNHTLTVPGDTASAYLTFAYDPNLTDYLPEIKTLSFPGVAANAFGPVQLTLDLRGDINNTNAFFIFRGEDGTTLGTTSGSGAGCGIAGQKTLTINTALFNTWAADGVLEITAEPNNIPIPPGGPGDGINPCDPGQVTTDGDTDGVSYLFGTLNYSSLTPTFYAQGANPIPPTTVSLPDFIPTYEFNRGVTQVFYVLEDQANNISSCSFLLTVEDNTDPEANCQDIGILEINPSGLQTEVVDVSEVDDGSFDNCGIDTMYITPSSFTCANAGSPVDVTLTVIDSAGNMGTCTTTVGISLSKPSPTFNSGLCGGDTLFLFANPPAPGPQAYTYTWFFESNQVGNTQNLVIPNIDPSFSGFYTVRITGAIGGCFSEESVFVPVIVPPLEPTLTSTTTICTINDIVLSTPDFPSGNNVIFKWYGGTPPNGTLLGTTSVQSFTIPGPHVVGSRQFYLIIEANGCESSPSDPLTVNSVVKPIATVTYADTTECAGETINLGAQTVGGNVVYHWTGPGFSSNTPFPPVGPLEEVDEGFYYLTVNRGGCISEPDSVFVNVKPKPARPSMFNNTPICEGESLVLTTSASGASAYHWLRSGVEMAVTATPSFTIPAANGTHAGAWTVIVTKNGCDSDASLVSQVIVRPLPVASATAVADEVCIGNSFQLFAQPQGATYEWNGPGISTRFIPNPIINNVSQANEGVYTLEVTLNGCSDTASVFVDILNRVNILNVTSNAPSCLNGPTDIQLTPTVFPFDNNNSYQYHWTGPSYTSNSKVATISSATAAVYRGEYFLTVTSSEGCQTVLDSAFFLDIRDVPAMPSAPATVSGAVQFCQGNQITLTTTPYSGNNVTYYWTLPGGGGTQTTNTPTLIINAASPTLHSGDYRVQVLVDGCQSMNSPPRTITVYPKPNLTATSNSPVCRGDQIILNAQHFDNSEYSWFGPNDFSSSLEDPINNSANQSMAIGTYRVIARVNGCPSDTVFLQVEVKDRPAEPDPLTIGPVCASTTGATISLDIAPGSATPGATYSWYNNPGGTNALAPASTDPNLIVTDFTNYPTDGIYQFYVRANLNNCSSTISDPVPVQINYVPNISPFAGQDTLICDGSIVTLHAEAPSVGTGRWSQVNGSTTGVTITNPMMPTTVVNGLTIAGGPYSFRWTLSNGACANFASDDVEVTLSQGEAAATGGNITACFDDVITLNATPPQGPSSIGVWSQLSAQMTVGNVVIVDSLNPTTLVSGLKPDNIYSFFWTVTSDCGVDTEEINIIISDPNPKAGLDGTPCNNNQTGTLSATEPTMGSNGRWTSLTPEVTIDFPTNENTTVRNLQPGENRFIWAIDDSFCDAQDTVVLFYKVPPIPSDDIVPVAFGETTSFDVLLNDIVPPGSTATVLTGPDEGTVVNDVNGFVYTPPINFVGTDEMIYQIESEGCETVTAQVQFEVGDGVACKVPSIITPNGDGINDQFVVPCLLDTQRFSNSSVIIFNRWGDEVFRSKTPYQNNWQGTYNGEELPADTYFYVIDFGNGTEAVSGFVVIQR